MTRFLIKGLIRDRSRSLFPVLMVGSGVFLCVFLYSYMNGAIGDMLDASARFDTGHVKVMTRAYSELASQMPNDLALLDAAKKLEKLRTGYPHMIWTERIRFGGLLDIPDDMGDTRSQGPFFGMAINLLNGNSPDLMLLDVEKAIVRGRMPEMPNEILISDTFAAKLKVVPGEKATLISSTMNGAMAMHNFVVAGTIRFGMVMIDKSTIIADINDIRKALDMEDCVGEILGFMGDTIYDDNKMRVLAGAYNMEYTSEDDEFSPLMTTLSEQGVMGDILQLSTYAVTIVVGIFVFAMSIVLWNAGLMNGIRRYGEIGVRLAMGESKGAIYRAMIIESVCIGLVGSVMGTLAGLAASYYLQIVGFDISGMLQKSSIMISSVIRAKVSLTSYYIGFLPGVFASVLGTIFAGIGIYRRQTSQLFKELEV